MEHRHAFGGPIDSIEHEAVQMDVEIGGRAETLDQGDGEGHGLGALESRLLGQKCGDDPVDDLQDRGEELGTWFDYKYTVDVFLYTNGGQ